jgi:hypothetical protein
MKPFKILYGKEYTKWLQSVAFVDDDGNVKKASHSDMLKNVWNAWQKLPPSLVIKSFKCAGLGLPLDGSQDDAIYSYDLQEEMHSMGLKSSNLKKKTMASPEQASSSSQVVAPPGEEPAPDSDDVVLPPILDIPSDEEAADAAITDLDAKLARSLALNLRPRK